MNNVHIQPFSIVYSIHISDRCWQVDTDVSGSIIADLDAGYPCRHDEVYIFIVAGERKLMNYFVDNVQRTASIRLFQRGFLHRHPSVASEARKTSEQCPNLRLKAALSDLVFALILPTW